MTPGFSLFIPLPPGMNIAYWCLPSRLLVESPTLPGARILRNTMALSIFYRNLGTLLRFFVIPYSAGTWTLAEQSLCFVFACKKIPQIRPSYKHLKGKKKENTSFHMNIRKNQKTLKTSLPVNSCYLYMNHSHLIGIHVLAQDYGGGVKKVWFFFPGMVVLWCPKETS